MDQCLQRLSSISPDVGLRIPFQLGLDIISNLVSLARLRILPYSSSREHIDRYQLSRLFPSSVKLYYFYFVLLLLRKLEGTPSALCTGFV